MNKPTYINWDYRKSEKFDGGSRVKIMFNRPAASGPEEYTSTKRLITQLNEE